MMPDRPPETVREYLDQLRRALKGAPAGLIADALADCEEYLDNEIAQNPGVDQRSVLASVEKTYGSPEEIAEEYRDMEAAIAGPFPKAERPERPRHRFFGVIGDPRTYGALLYMLLALPTGIFYFVWAVTGISLTLGFAVLIIGIPFALLFVGSVRVLSHVEGRLVEGLLGVRMPRRLPAPAGSEQTLFSRIRDALTDSRTWSSLLYFLLMLPLGVTYFVLAVVGISVSVGLTGGGLLGLVTNASYFQIQVVPWLDHLAHTAPGLLLFALIGVLLFIVTLHAARGIGWLHGRIAEVLLVRL
ncbi:MAG: sensor domain-containing protein [Alphaproteobacteria bacterium]|nr:sensor domain-containing protein [Alphaproteobacteria bacterium]